MRMWMIDPKLMCDHHLIKEHMDLHHLAHLSEKSKAIRPFVLYVDTGRIEERHNEVSEEMERRGMLHATPLEFTTERPFGQVDPSKSLKDLYRRCTDCKARIDANTVGDLTNARTAR